VSADSRIVIELDARERRLYDRLRSRVSPPQLAGRTGVRDLMLLLPDLVVLLARLLRDPRVPIGSKGIALLGIGYIFSPIDLIPEIFLGPIGVIDDLFIVATALSMLLNRVHPDVVRSHWSGQGDALDAIHRVTEWAESQTIGRVRGAVRRLFPAGR
jgi:uncharacterized membrane protein YkvA (DUF1232 family)